MGHEEREHALLSASSAEKWLHCPVSARVEEFLSEGKPADESPAAKEGTLAHEIAELKARKKFNLPESNESDKPMDKQTFTDRMNALKEHELYQEEMQRYTDDYIDFLESVWLKYPNTPTVAVEVRVDYSRWAREGFGTSDCIMVGGDTLFVIDFKYGKGVRVSAKDNAQLRLYAAGAYWAYKPLYNIKNIRMAIVQPRIACGITEDEIDYRDLMEWCEQVVYPAAEAAYRGKGKACAGKWCRDHFCKIRSGCNAYAKSQMSLMDNYASPENAQIPIDTDMISGEDLGNILTRARPFIDWIHELEKYALGMISQGETVPGWKVVEGKSVRTFTEPEKAFAALQASGIDKTLLYKPKERISLAAAEKLTGKAEFNQICGEFITKPPGKPTLAPESDPRLPYDFGNSIEDDFGEIVPF